MVWCLLLMVTACAATSPPNSISLFHEALIFPCQTSTDFAKIIPSISTFKAVTVCLRVKTDLCRDHALISWASGYSDNTFTLYWDDSHDLFQVYINGVEVEYKGLNYDPNKWHSICVTWDSATGFVQMWFDGHYTALKYVGGGHITNPCIVIGQEQDSYCGGFNEHQSFVGETTDVHIWDKVIGVCEIQHYMDYQNFCPGNAVSWRDLTIFTSGKVTTGDVQICLQDYPQSGFPVLSNTEDYPPLSNSDDYYYNYPYRYLLYPFYRPYTRDYTYNKFSSRYKEDHVTRVW